MAAKPSSRHCPDYRLNPEHEIDNCAADRVVLSREDDAQGRLWTGTHAHDFTPGLGALYRIDPDGMVTTMLKEVGQSNGLDCSPDGAEFYFIDSFTRSIDAFDFDAARGAIGRRRTIATIPMGEGAFDGMIVDREGCLWVAVFGTGRSVGIRPMARFWREFRCVFRGADGGDLFITSAAIQIPDGVLPILACSKDMVAHSHTAPGAGGLFVCRPGRTAAPATPFAG
jgi:sugar lactone lactonase YvrE